MEKMRYNARTTLLLTTPDGKNLTNDREILKEQRKFYQELFTKDPQVSFQLENEDKDDIIDPQSLAATNNPFSDEEIAKAIQGLNNGKTPGCDGIVIEFYKVFWSGIKEMLCDAIRLMYEEHRVCDSMSKGIINLIPKPGKDSLQMKNLRPITLLNCDYKIIEKAIANRMEQVMDDVIHEDQQGFFKKSENLQKYQEDL